MKIQIDVEQKTIRVEENVNLFDFMEMVRKTIHPDMLKEFKLITGTIIEWKDPIIIYRDQWHYPLYPITPYPLTPINPYPQNPTFPPYYVGDPLPGTEPYKITCNADGENMGSKSTNFVLNFEIN